MAITLDGTNGINSSGVIVAPDGSASAPAITNDGDTNTGIFFPAADTIAFAEGGVECARFNADAQFVAAAGTASLPVITTTGDVNTGIFFPAADTIAFAEGGAEAMRIDSSGNLLLNTTSQLFSGKFFVAVPCNTLNPIALQNTVTQGAGQSFMFMANSAGNKAGSIDHTGTTTVAYTTSSDYRMKENIAPMTGALTAVLQLKPCTYTWKEDGKAGQGFIAHELQEVVPDCVSGAKDAVDAEGKPVYQGIDTSFLVATLTAAIQELSAKNDALEARIAALEGSQT
jgi:hypothetical protein